MSRTRVGLHSYYGVSKSILIIDTSVTIIGSLAIFFFYILPKTYLTFILFCDLNFERNVVVVFFFMFCGPKTC